MANPPTTAAAEHLIDSQQEPQLLYQPPPPASYNLSFPPFPHLQNNTPLIPFADFVPKGTQIKVDENEDEEETQDRTSAVERDGEGVPTVMLGVTHDLGKSNKKSAKGRSRGSKTRADGTPKPWFEQWADNEDLMRAEPLNFAQFTPHEILVQADIDFQHRRFFPLSVRALYDEFRVFLGIIERMEKRPPFVRLTKQQPDAPSSTPDATQQQSSNPEADDEHFSDDVDLDDDEIGIPTSKIYNKSDDSDSPLFSRPHMPPATASEDTYEEEDYSGSLKPLLERSQLPAPTRSEQFLANPALAVKCFLSHEFRNRGLYWLEFNLHAGPILVLAFLEFIIRHELFPKAQYGEALKEAAEVARKAREELPKTKKASTVLRDGWGTVCIDIWGSREEVQWGIDGFSWSPLKADDEGYITELSDVPVATLIEENDEPLILSPTSGDDPAVEALPDSNSTAPVAVVPNKLSNDSLKTATTVVADATTRAGGWGAHSSRTSSTDVPAEGESASTPLAAGAPATLEDTTHGWGDREDEENEYLAGAPTWEDPSPAPSMFTYVGCASFPLTHAPVRAERSVREILAIEPPMDIFASTPASPIGLLHSKLATVTLGPWRNGNNDNARSYRDGGEIPPPIMLRMCSSEREAKRTEKDDHAEEEYPTQFFRTGEVGRSHDAFKDVITVFVDPAIIGSLTVGLGIGGTFVQVARRLDAPTFPAIKDGNAVHALRYGIGNGVNQCDSPLPPYKPNDGRSWWYLDNVSQVVPSYWTSLDDLPSTV